LSVIIQLIVNILPLEIEMPVQIILAKAELYGFGFNKAYLAELNETVNKLMKNISEQSHDLSGSRFNMQSTLEWAKVKILTICVENSL